MNRGQAETSNANSRYQNRRRIHFTLDARGLPSRPLASFLEPVVHMEDLSECSDRRYNLNSRRLSRPRSTSKDQYNCIFVQLSGRGFCTSFRPPISVYLQYSPQNLGQGESAARVALPRTSATAYLYNQGASKYVYN